MRTRSVLLWPFEMLWGLLRLLFWPALVGGLAWWLLPQGWFLLVVLLICLYALLVFRVWAAVWRGSMRTMARGTFTVRNQRTRRSGRPRLPRVHSG